MNKRNLLYFPSYLLFAKFNKQIVYDHFVLNYAVIFVLFYSKGSNHK